MGDGPGTGQARAPSPTRHAPGVAADPVRARALARLQAAGCVAAEAEADELLAAVGGGPALDEALARREQGVPLAWITGTTTFCGRAIHVAPGTYVPRAQTEELARRAAALLPRHGRALDLCTGVGAVAAHLRSADPTAAVVGIDRDPRAAACARRNRVPSLAGDLAAAVRTGTSVDLVTAVAPYVPTGSLGLLPTDVVRHEPGAALDGGPDGLAVVRRVVAAARRHLGPGGWLLVEVGGDQDRELAADLDGFDEITSWHDEEGDLRGVAARWTGLSAGRALRG